MEPNEFQNTGDADQIRKEMEQAQQQARQQQAQKMDGILTDVADKMEQEERDLKDDGRRHVDMKETLQALQASLANLLQA